MKIRIEAPQSVAPGQTMPIRVIMTSNKVGHDYPTGPLDMIQSWVELRVDRRRGAAEFSLPGSAIRDTSLSPAPSCSRPSLSTSTAI